MLFAVPCKRCRIQWTRGARIRPATTRNTSLVERKPAGEQLARRRLRRVDRPHTSKQHGRVQERVPGRQYLVVPVAPHAEAQGNEHHEGGNGEVAQ